MFVQSWGTYVITVPRRLEVQCHHLAAEGIDPVAIDREHDAAGIADFHGNPVREDPRARCPGGDIRLPFQGAVWRVHADPAALGRCELDQHGPVLLARRGRGGGPAGRRGMGTGTVLRCAAAFT